MWRCVPKPNVFDNFNRIFIQWNSTTIQSMLSGHRWCHLWWSGWPRCATIHSMLIPIRIILLGWLTSHRYFMASNFQCRISRTWRVLTFLCGQLFPDWIVDSIWFLYYEYSIRGGYAINEVVAPNRKRVDILNGSMLFVILLSQINKECWLDIICTKRYNCTLSMQFLS